MRGQSDRFDELLKAMIPTSLHFSFFLPALDVIKVTSQFCVSNAGYILFTLVQYCVGKKTNILKVAKFSRSPSRLDGEAVKIDKSSIFLSVAFQFEEYFDFAHSKAKLLYSRLWIYKYIC